MKAQRERNRLIREIGERWLAEDPRRTFPMLAKRARHAQDPWREAIAKHPTIKKLHYAGLKAAFYRGKRPAKRTRVVHDGVATTWHPMNEIKATGLTNSTELPNMVFSLPISALPTGIQSMPGLKSAYVSSYIVTQPAPGGVSAQGEFAVVRLDGLTNKAYNFVFGLSSDGGVHFAGPFKGIPAHYFHSSQAVPVASLFVGHPNRRDK